MMRTGQEVREVFPRMQWLSRELEELKESFLGSPSIPRSSKPTPAFHTQLWLPSESWENVTAWSWDPSKPQRHSWVRSGQTCSSLVQVDLMLLPDVPVVISRANGPRSGQELVLRQREANTTPWSSWLVTQYLCLDGTGTMSLTCPKSDFKSFASQICSFHVSSTHVVVSSSFQLLRP